MPWLSLQTPLKKLIDCAKKKWPTPNHGIWFRTSFLINLPSFEVFDLAFQAFIHAFQAYILAFQVFHLAFQAFNLALQAFHLTFPSMHGPFKNNNVWSKIFITTANHGSTQGEISPQGSPHLKLITHYSSKAVAKSSF